MGRNTIVGCDLEFTNCVRTLVLVGPMGDGKSSTGNSILGTKDFKSKLSSGRVTTTCELHSTVLENGQNLDVIDTPGLFGFSVEHGMLSKDVLNCIKMAKDGIHAVLVVLSVRTRFSREAEDGIKHLQQIFGTKIWEYMIVVFTSGDCLEKDGETLEGYLGSDCPDPLKETIAMCGNRCILFDNRTKDPCKKSQQRNELCLLVGQVLLNSNGKPYTNDLFLEMQELGGQLAKEQGSRLKAEEEMLTLMEERFTAVIETCVLEIK